MVRAGPIHATGHGTSTSPVTNAKMTLFDFSDKTGPKEQSTWTLNGTYSNGFCSHCAVLYFRKRRVAVMPISIYNWWNDSFGVTE